MKLVLMREKKKKLHKGREPRTSEMLDTVSTTKPLMDTNVLCKFMYLFSTVKNLGTNCILLLIYINIVACNACAAGPRSTGPSAAALSVVTPLQPTQEEENST